MYVGRSHVNSRLCIPVIIFMVQVNIMHHHRVSISLEDYPELRDQLTSPLSTLHSLLSTLYSPLSTLCQDPLDSATSELKSLRGLFLLTIKS